MVMDAQVRAAADQGDLIGAIKLLRERTGLGLKEAKDAIDSYLQGAVPNAAPVDGGLPLAAIVALQEGKLIEAIRLTREASRSGLKDSKDAVERYLAANPAIHEQFKAAARSGRRTPWLAILILAVVIAALLVVLLR